MSKSHVVLALVVASSHAFAEETRYKRPQDVKIAVSISDRAKPHEPERHAAKPLLTGTQALEIEGLKGVYRGQQEELLVELIRDTPDSDPDKPNYLFMLGELYAKQQRYHRLRAIEAGSQAEAQAAKVYLIKAVKTYDALTSNALFRNFAEMDTALFYDGYTLQSGKYVDEARKVFDKLLTDYPKSKYVPEAHFAFAEYYFEHNQLADAESRYRKVLLFPKSSAYWYAMYKLGWIELNLGKPQGALETFYQVARGATEGTLVHAARKDFVRAYAEIGRADKAYDAFRRLDTKAALDLLQVLGDFYLDQGKSDKAIYVYRELMHLAPTHANVCAWQYAVANATLGMAGATTGDKVKQIEDLVRLYRAIKGNQDCHDNAAAMSGELARAYHSEGVRTKNPETFAFAERLYRAYLDAFPEVGDHADLEYYYAELLWARADGERNPRVKTEAWATAAEAFIRVVKAGKVSAKLIKVSAYAAVLGYKNALDIDPRPAKQAGPIDDKNYDKVPTALPIPTREQNMIDAFELYLTYVKDPNDDERVGMKFLEANTFRRYNHFAQAVPLLVDIVTDHRDHETAEYAAQLLLDTYNRMQRYDDMLALSDRIAADHGFVDGKPALTATTHKLKRQWLRKQAEQLEKAAAAGKDLSKYVACGEAYLAIYNFEPEAADNDQVLYNALVCYQDAKSIGAAVLAYSKLKQYYPTSPLYARATARIGRAYADVAFFDKAAEKLEEYAKQYAGEQDAYRALDSVVFYNKGIGDDAKAIENTKYFIRMFGGKRPRDAASAMFSLTSVYEKRGDTDALITHLRAYLRDYGDEFGADRRVIAYAKIGQALWEQSCPIKQVDGSCVKIVRERAITAKAHRAGVPTQCGPESKIKLTSIARDPHKVTAAREAFAAAAHEFAKAQDDPVARHYFAEAKFVEADRDFETYLALAFPSNLDFTGTLRAKSSHRFDAWLAERQKIGGVAKARYDAVLAIKDNATSIAAAARIAQLSQNLSDALFTAELPASIRTGPFAADKVEAFCDKLTEIAEPLDTAALHAYSECLAQSTKLGWFSEWSKLCERELGQIRPELFPTALELRSAVDRAASIVTSEPPVEL